VHPHIGHSSDRKRCPGGPHTCEHQRTHAGLSSTRQLPPIACTPSLAAALVGTPQQRLASAKSAASTKLWKRPGLPPGMLQHSPCDRPPTCRQQRSALTSPTAWHTIWSRRYSALGAARRGARSRPRSLAIAGRVNSIPPNAPHSGDGAAVPGHPIPTGSRLHRPAPASEAVQTIRLAPVGPTPGPPHHSPAPRPPRGEGSLR
jgi:hypothetical protein